MKNAKNTLLSQLHHDQTHGASELALIILKQLYQFMQLNEINWRDGLSWVDELKRLRPSMAPLSNALDQWQLSDYEDLTHCLQHLDHIITALQQAHQQVAQHACSLIQPGQTLLTHSRSSAVLSLFQELNTKEIPFQVIITASAPGNEGYQVAQQLNQLGVNSTIITDAQIGLFIPQAHMVICGCDTWLADHCFVNKSGSYLLALAAQDRGIPFWVLADCFKSSNLSSSQITLEEMPSAELNAPKGEYIHTRNIYFEIIPERLVTGRVDEHGTTFL